MEDTPFGKLAFVLLVIVIAACVIVVWRYAMNGYEEVEGRVIGHAYTAGQNGSGYGLDANGRPLHVSTFSTDKYTLMVEVDGAVSSYDVSADLYSKVIAGQTTVTLRCNQVLCAVVE